MTVHKISSTALLFRRWAAWCIFGVGFGLIIYVLLLPGNPGIPGWEPVNNSLHATLEARSQPPVPASNSSVSVYPAAGMQDPSDLPPLSKSLPESSNLPIDSSHVAGMLNLNTAIAEELEDLPGIGPSKAQAILAYRNAHKGFREVEELLQVKGVGPKLYDQIRSLVMIDSVNR